MSRLEYGDITRDITPLPIERPTYESWSADQMANRGYQNAILMRAAWLRAGGDETSAALLESMIGYFSNDVTLLSGYEQDLEQAAYQAEVYCDEPHCDDYCQPRSRGSSNCDRPHLPADISEQAAASFIEQLRVRQPMLIR
jgi:hypothetical protein